jgi:hypothetical protein
MRQRYFHGGKRGLQVGDYILPPAETGLVSVAGSNNLNYRPDRVYVTSSIDVARYFGSGYLGKEIVYEVVPDEELALDPDDTRPGSSFACPKARIIAIHKIPGKVIKKHQKAMMKRAHELEKARVAKGPTPAGQ